MRRVVAASLGLLVATVVGAAAVPTAAAAPPGVTARFATYNIHAGAGQDNVYDLDRTAAAIRALDADVVGLEEVDVHWGDRSQWQDVATELGRRLGMQVAFAPIYSLDPVRAGDPRREFGVAVLSRWDIVDVENHDITRLSTQVPNPVPEPAPGFLEATIQVRGARTHVYVTHLDYRADPSVRVLQVADTRAILAQDPPGANQVLLGDLNADVASPELRPLFVDLRDAWSSAPAHEGGSGLTYPALVPEKRIDVVASSRGIQVRAAAVQDDPELVPASDHRAVVATLTLAQGSESAR